MPERVRDYALLVAVTAALTLPNLGATSLWDVDEGVNAQAAREMHDNDTWVIPTFNSQLRTAKPVMLYWLQRLSFAAFGVSEWSARLPSVLAAIFTVLLTYELARRMFGRPTGLLAGVVLASAIEFCVLAHAATPDATLLLFTALTFFLFWRGHENGSRKWWVPTAFGCGLAVLTKGPVGVALPGLVLLLYFAWNRELGRLLDRKILTAGLVFLLVAGPWYALVTAETRGAWLRAFLGTENMHRFTTPMQNHRGPIYYHAAGLFVLFAPWSIFLCAAVWYGVKAARASHPVAAAPEPDPSTRAHRFLLCWFAGYLVFFSVAATKLPNYVLPLYPAVAILTARFLTRWREGELPVPRWLMPAAVGGLVLTAVVATGGLLVAGDAVKLLPRGARVFPGLERWALLGLVPLAAAVVMALAVRANARARFVRAMAAGAVAFTGLLAALAPLAVDPYKAPRELVRASGAGDPARDLRLGHHCWFQPSLVFYAGREVPEVIGPDGVVAFLATPTPGYLFVPANVWDMLEPLVPVPTQVVARHYDFYRNFEVLVVTNDVTATAGR